MIIVFNPVAGRRRHRELKGALDAFHALGATPRLVETRAAGDATSIARQAAKAGAPLVVAAGGDGTIAEVAQGLSGSATQLGILPMGTANVLAHELELPLRGDLAARVISEGVEAALHPGLARFADGTTRLFVQMLGAGFDARVVAALDLGLKHRLGRAAYVWQTLRELPRYRFPRCEVEIDGARCQAASVVVTKGRLYGGNYMLAPKARVDAPGFQVALLRDAGAVRTLLAGLALPLGLPPYIPGLELRPAREVRLHGAALAVQMDGDPAGTLPVEVAAAPAPLIVRIARAARIAGRVPP
jgi:diacylglycerol kinase (ATP)